MKKIFSGLAMLVMILVCGVMFWNSPGGTTIAYAHTFTNITRIEPTCTEAGRITYECIYCGETYEVEIPPLGHDYHESARTEPTTEAAGSITYTCTRCGDSYTTVIPQLQTDQTAGDQVTGSQTAVSTDITDAGTAGERSTSTDLSAATVQTSDNIDSTDTGTVVTGSITQTEEQQTADSFQTAQNNAQPDLVGQETEPPGCEMTFGSDIEKTDQNEISTGTEEGAQTTIMPVPMISQFNEVSVELIVCSISFAMAGALYFLSYLPLFRWAKRERQKARKRIFFYVE